VSSTAQRATANRWIGAQRDPQPVEARAELRALAEFPGKL
jgi:hypothetical protein